MSKTVINKRDQIKWDNGFDPNGKSIPDITESDEGKFIKVVDGVLAFGEGGGSGSTYTAGDNIQISAENVISATDTTYTAGDNVAISANNEISSVNTIVFDAKYFRATDTFQYDDTAIAPFLTEVFKNDKRAIVRVQDGNYNIYDIYTLISYESVNNRAAFSKTKPSIVSANQREIGCANIALTVNNGVGTLTYTTTGVTALPEGATQGQIPISDGHNGWVAGNIPTELPSYSSSEDGKVLSVDSNGDLEWVTPGSGSSYTAGDGIEISAQDVISSPEAVMAKEGIADEYEGLTFYPAFTSAAQSSGNNMYTDCCAAASTEPFPGDIRVWGVRVYTLDGTEAYWYLKHGDDQDIWHIDIVVPTSSTVQGTVYVDYVNSNGNKTYTSDIDIATYGREFTGTVNPGKWWDFEIQGGSSSVGFPIIQCAFDLSNCIYTSDQAGYEEFGNNPIPTENYNEGDQVWKDGKLQTYTSGAWVDSDTIVEQLANAKELPSYSSSDNGKVLSVDSNGDLEWAKVYRDLVGTLTAGQTTISFNSPSITTTATYDYYTDVYGVNPTAVTVSTGNMVLTFEAQQSDLHVKVRVW